MESCSSRKEFDVYEFKDDTEEQQKVLKKFLPCSDDTTSPSSKYNFLKTFSSGVVGEGKKTTSICFVDVDENDSSYKGAHTLKCAGKEENVYYAAAAAACWSVDHPLGELPFNNNVEVVVDEDEGMSYCSDIGEDEGSLDGSASDRSCSDWDMDNLDMAISVTPDYLMYKDKYCTESSLSFSPSCIKLEGVNAYGSKEFVISEWGIADVISIESQWYAMVGTALVKLCVRSTEDLGVENPNGTSGIGELKFAVCDSRWFEKRNKIMSMDARYEAIWRVESNAKEVDVYVGQNQICRSKRYHPMYLKNKIRPEERTRFHFFNSFFFRKLADLDKDPSSASEGRAAFLRVRKWTRKVNLFEKDYVVIPVNFNLHWSLIVICHPGEVATSKDNEVHESRKVPCILHMDSIKGSHKGLKNLVQSYLWEEWKERQPESSEEVSSNFLNLRFVPLEVLVYLRNICTLPQQENSFDCGLFLLHYVELFLEEAPVNFNPFKLTKFSNFLNVDWFSPAEASLKRTFIQKLIYDLLKEHSQEIPTAACDKECHSRRSMRNNSEKENALESFLEGQIPAKACNGFSSCSNDDQGIEIKLLETPGGIQYLRESGLVLKELFEPGTFAESVSNCQFRAFDHTSFNKLKTVMSPIKEDEAIGKQFTFSPSGSAGCRQLTGYGVVDACTTSYISNDFEIYNGFSSSEVLTRQNEDDVDLSSETSSCGSQSSSEVIVDEKLPDRGLWQPNRQEAEERRLVSPENNVYVSESSASGCSEGLDNCIVEDSQEVDRVVEHDEKRESLSCLDKVPASTDHRQAHSGGNENHLGGNEELREGIDASESDEREAKRTRLTLLLEDEKRCTRSSTKDLDL
ncbi:hypothetical protein IFM89_010455 [Coptis chinensis]|uniref:Ubiquitin-like protease family profile domain-containing protein n=1 Tax=Coptis chinensis TaxID=261450 RepID=A0A835HZQ3_9MAGN|nr:hypothetical protein IFM89_010455 [Coptis chinensis]